MSSLTAAIVALSMPASCSSVSPVAAIACAAASTRALRCSGVAAGMCDSISDIAASTNVPVGLPLASRMIFPPSGSRVAAVTPAARSAAVFATAAWPSTRSSSTG
jgi:hypothetical protein